MKIEKNVRIKKDITIYDLANVIETVVPFIIRKDEDGITYTPYYRELGANIGIAKYLIEGIEFEEDDDILNEISNNKKINGMIAQFSNTNPEDYSFILTNVADIVEQKKQEYSALDFSDIKERLLKSIEQEQMLNNLNIKLAKKQNTILSQQTKANEFQMKVMEFSSPEEVAALNKKFLSEEYNVNDIAEMAVEKYLNSEIHKGNQKELIDSQARKIIQMNEHKSTNDARNVLADVDDGK